MPRQSANPDAPPRLFDSVSRRTYWLGVGTLMLALIVVSWWLGLYTVDAVEEQTQTRVSGGDPLGEFLYSPLGNAVVMLVMQFLLANVLFWGGAWATRPLWRGDRQAGGAAGGPAGGAGGQGPSR